MMARKEEEKYAAKLLYQYRVDVNGVSNKIRTCIESIIIIYAKSAKMALNKAKKRSKKTETHYINDDGNKVFLECVGIMDLMHLGVECEDDEVWYEVKDYLSPMERKDKFIPAENKLLTLLDDTSKKLPRALTPDFLVKPDPENKKLTSSVNQSRVNKRI